MCMYILSYVDIKVLKVFICPDLRSSLNKCSRMKYDHSKNHISMVLYVQKVLNYMGTRSHNVWLQTILSSRAHVCASFADHGVALALYFLEKCFVHLQNTPVQYIGDENQEPYRVEKNNDISYTVL